MRDREYAVECNHLSVTREHEVNAVFSQPRYVAKSHGILWNIQSLPESPFVFTWLGSCEHFANFRRHSHQRSGIEVEELIGVGCAHFNDPFSDRPEGGFFSGWLSFATHDYLTRPLPSFTLAGRRVI